MLMIRFLCLALSIEAGCVAEDQKMQVRNMDDDSNGYVEMNSERRLFISYDGEPDAVYTSAPGDRAYSGYIELAGGLEPGQKRRLRKAVAMYEMTAEGSYSIFQYVQASGAVSEPGVNIVDKSSSEYRCYEEVLKSPQDGAKHYLLLSDWRKISECLEALTTTD